MTTATNLNKAIIDGVNQLRQEEERNRGEEKVVSMLIVLTDGEPTYGEKDEAQIERNVREVIDGDYSLFALGFGEDVDFPFLTRLALQVRQWLITMATLKCLSVCVFLNWWEFDID